MRGEKLMILVLVLAVARCWVRYVVGSWQLGACSEWKGKGGSWM